MAEHEVTNPRSNKWIDLFAKNRQCEVDTAIRLMPQEGDRATLIEEDTKAKAIKDTLRDYLVGHFSSRKTLKEMTKRWMTSHKMHTHDTFWMIFKFDTK